MRKTLYLKFILAYIIFGLFGFIAVATVGSSLTTENVRRRVARNLYQEATEIAGTYASPMLPWNPYSVRWRLWPPICMRTSGSSTPPDG